MQKKALKYIDNIIIDTYLKHRWKALVVSNNLPDAYICWQGRIMSVLPTEIKVNFSHPFRHCINIRLIIVRMKWGDHPWKYKRQHMQLSAQQKEGNSAYKWNRLFEAFLVFK